MGNNPMVGATVAVAVSIEEAAKEGKFQEIVRFQGFQKYSLVQLGTFQGI